MDEEILTEDPNGTKPTDIIGDELEQIDDGLAETIERPHADDLYGDPDDTIDLMPRKRLGFSDIAAYIKRRPGSIALLMLVSIAVVLMLVRAYRRSNNLPDLELIEQDARERIEAPAYSGCYFGNDDRLILTQVTVGTRQHSDHAPEGSDLDETFGAMSYVTTDVMLTFQNESVIATKTATLGYAKQGSSWIDAGEVTNEQISYIATAGVDQRKALRNIGQILERASSIAPAEEGLASLATIYEGADFEVTSSAFDDVTQTDTLTIHARKGGLFSAYECDIVASFAFRAGNGLWELTEAAATDDAWVRRFDPLVGTWSGTFKSQEVSSGTKCLAGASTPLTITITSWSDAPTGTRISGTISGVAHYHRNPEKDADATSGDTVLDNVAFTATLVDPTDSKRTSEAIFTATLPEAVGGKVTITLEFGTGTDGAGVTAIVATEHQFEDTFMLIPYKKQVIYADTYELVLEPEEDDQETDADAEAGAKADDTQQEADAAAAEKPAAAPAQP